MRIKLYSILVYNLLLRSIYPSPYFKMIKQGLHDERLTRCSSSFRAERAVQGTVLGLA